MRQKGSMEKFNNIPESTNLEFKNDENSEKAPLTYEKEMKTRDHYERAFNESKLNGTLPEGVTDPYELREYMEEKQAHESEVSVAEEKTNTEKMEKIGTFEKRLALNKDFYDRAAFSRAYAFVTNSYEPYESLTSGEDCRDLMGLLYAGVSYEDINDLETFSLYKDENDGQYSPIEKDFVVRKAGSKQLSAIYSLYRKSRIEYFEKEIESDNDAAKRAREIMNTDTFEKDFNEFLNADSKQISSTYIESIEKEMNELDERSGGLFIPVEYNNEAQNKFHRQTVMYGDSHAIMPGENPIIPSLESRLRLEEQLFAIKKKIADIISEVKKREYQEEATSDYGKRVISRLENSK